MLLFSPLEQFEIVSLVPVRLGSFDFSLTNSSFILLFIFGLFCLVFLCLVLFGQGFFIPNRWQLIFESFYAFSLAMVVENIGRKGESFFPFVFSLFSFLVLCNLVGLVPYSYTVTSQLVVTLALSLLVWVGKLFVGFQLHGIRLFGILLPSGVPFALVPFFVAVELLGFFTPLAALGIRLFANIIAGHILLKVIVGFCWGIMAAGGSLFFGHFIPLFVLFLLLFLETAVALIQAYVFTILTCLIVGDMVRGAH